MNEDRGNWHDWIGLFLKIWDRYTMNKTYDAMWMNLICRIAYKDTSGVVDWAHYYPLILTKVLNTLKVPVGNTRGDATFSKFTVILFTTIVCLLS